METRLKHISVQSFFFSIPNLLFEYGGGSDDIAEETSSRPFMLCFSASLSLVNLQLLMRYKTIPKMTTMPTTPPIMPKIISYGGPLQEILYNSV